MFGLNYLIVSLIITIPTYLYLFYVLKRVFKDTFWDAFAKFLFVSIVYFGVFIVMGVIAFIVGVLFVLTMNK